MSKINLNALKKNFDNDTKNSVVSSLNLSETTNGVKEDNNIELDKGVEDTVIDTTKTGIKLQLNKSVPENIVDINLNNLEKTIEKNNIIKKENLESKVLSKQTQDEKKEFNLDFKEETLNSLGEKKDLFSNYQSETKKIETTLIEKLKKLGNSKYIKTNKAFLFLIITITFFGILIIFISNPNIHSLQNYKSSIVNSYEDFTKSGSGKTLTGILVRNTNNIKSDILENKVINISGTNYNIDTHTSILYSPSGNSFSFVAEINGKYFVVKDGKKSNIYGKVYNLIYSPSGNSFSFIAENAGKQFVVQDGKESNKYDRVYFLKYSSNGNSLSFIAENAGKQFFVQDGKEGIKYDITSSVSYSSNMKDFTFFAEKQLVLSLSNDFDPSDFKFVLPSKDWFFLTYEDTISIHGKVPKDIIKKLSINLVDTKVFNGTDWVYNISVKNNTLKNGINNYEIKYYGDNNNILYTNKYIILKRYKKNSK